MVYVPITPELSVAFGTPISMRMVANPAALNEPLERAILARRAKGEANRISNIGGWQSMPDLLDWPEPAIGILAAEVDQSVQLVMGLPAILEQRPPGKRATYQAYGWANVNRSGDYNTLHMHPGNHWSIVYYVATGMPSPDPPMNGRLELRDPRPAATFARMPGFRCGQPITIGPQPGMMLAFPSWIEHWVHPFHGEGNRISIALNVTLDPA